MDSKMCKICQNTNQRTNKGLDILGVHICKECINSMTEVDIGSMEYENYKLEIKELWIDYLALNY